MHSFDISIEMVKLCKEKRLEALVGDLENLPFEESSFYGVWAYTSLLHVPKKEFPSVLQGIKRVLRHEGVLYLGMKEGDFEGMITSETYDGSERFFALYSHDYLKRTLSELFLVFHSSKVQIGNAKFLNYLARRI